MNDIIKKLDNLTIADIAAVNLNDINFVSSNDKIRNYIDGMPGVEHYRLLCLLSTWFDYSCIYELGSFTGSSALCLAYNKSNYVISYDIEYCIDVKRHSNMEFRQGNFEYDKQLLQSPLLFIDVTHDGKLEKHIYNYLVKNNYKGLTIWDDIYLNDEMQDFWKSVTHEKRDLSKFGHYSGTGAIIFSGTEHFYKEEHMTRRAIFTYSNHQIDEKISYLQKQIINKFNTNKKCKYEYLHYKKPDGEMTPDQVIDYGINKLFYEDNYDTILMLDIDCIPLSEHALEYTFERAEQGVLIGNVQRSSHIENNKHIYPAPSCIALTKETFEKLGKPSFTITNRGDIGEELSYIAEQQSMTIEMYMPSKFEENPVWPGDVRKPWDLQDGQPQYGIGTTFVDNKGNEMFYHLFQSRVNIFNHLFFLKCASIML